MIPPAPSRPETLRSWSDEQIARALLTHVYRYLDAGGLSCGRSFQSEMLEPAMRLLDRYRPPGDIAEWPTPDATAAEARTRARDRDAALAGPQAPSGLEAKVREWFDAMDAADEPRDVKSDTPLDLVAHVEKVGRLRDEVRAVLGLPASPSASTEQK